MFTRLSQFFYSIKCLFELRIIRILGFFPLLIILISGIITILRLALVFFLLILPICAYDYFICLLSLIKAYSYTAYKRFFIFEGDIKQVKAFSEK